MSHRHDGFGLRGGSVPIIKVNALTKISQGLCAPKPFSSPPLLNSVLPRQHSGKMIASQKGFATHGGCAMSLSYFSPLISSSIS